MGKVPKLRFEGFTEEWEEKKLGELMSFSNGFNGGKELFGNGVKIISVMDILNNDYITHESIRGTVQIDDKTLSRFSVNYGDVLFQRSSENIEDAGKSNVYIGKETVAFGGFVIRGRRKKEYDVRYVKQLLDSKTIRKQIMEKAQGAQHINVSQEVLSSVAADVCTVNEQEQIGNVFVQIDTLITLHQRKYDALLKAKKFYLQNLFPKKGEKTPRLRFAGFSGEWEKKKFGEWGTFYYGYSCPKWSVTPDANVPCVRYGELYTKFGAKISQVYSYTKIPAKHLKLSKGTEVLIPRVGEDPMDYNHCTWLSLEGVAIGEMISVFNSDQDPLFSAMMFNATLQKDFAIRVEGGSVTNLYYDKLMNIAIAYPSLEEQRKIATFLDNLDILITTQQQKLETLKRLKQFMLQNLFV